MTASSDRARITDLEAAVAGLTSNLRVSRGRRTSNLSLSAGVSTQVPYQDVALQDNGPIDGAGLWTAPVTGLYLLVFDFYLRLAGAGSYGVGFIDGSIGGQPAGGGVWNPSTNPWATAWAKLDATDTSAGWGAVTLIRYLAAGATAAGFVATDYNTTREVSTETNLTVIRLWTP